MLGAAAVIAAAAYYAHARTIEDTDDAQVDGEISAVSPNVSAQVIAVHVSENERVKPGDLLIEIDPTEFEVAVAQARAVLAQAQAQLQAEEPNVEITQQTNGTLLAVSTSDVSASQADLAAADAALKQNEAQLVQARANEKLAQVELDRTKALVASGAVGVADLDQRTATADAARANVVALAHAVDAAKDRILQAQTRVAASASKAQEAEKNSPRIIAARKANVEIRKANVELAKAQLRQAELNLGYTKIRAPVGGIVGKKNVSVGDRVQPGQQLLAITQVDRLWVTANFRETQLQRIRTGQPVKIHVDSLDGELHGTVASIAGATGSRYSLLPPENASGNYVKVVQRVPVRILFDDGQPDVATLRPGLSVEPTVKVR